MMTFGQGMHAVEGQPRGAAPDDHVAMTEWHTARASGTRLPAPEEGSGKTERNRDDRTAEVSLIPILMQ